MANVGLKTVTNEGTDVRTNREAPFDHTGSNFDSFLAEEGILDEVTAVAIKRVSDWQAENTAVEAPPTEST